MGRLFGTDGIRGVASRDITVELATNIGRAAALVLTQGRRRRPLFVIGKDTRLSSDMLENALAAGLCSVGADVILLGVVPTPAVAFLVKHCKADAGIMVSASHNPYKYNGIKLFNGDGFKLADDLESRIEALVLDEPNELKDADERSIGTVSYEHSSIDKYTEFLKSTVPNMLSGLNIAFDCANGSASKTAQQLFSSMDINVHMLFDDPDGTNINEECGSTNMKALTEYVLKHHLDGGVAFDGDADRCLFVDEKGHIINGDHIMAICALDMQKRGKLRHNTVVGTIMANMALGKFLEEHGIRFISTKVGDRYVLEEIEMEGFRFGGEQSGHIIFRDFATAGDGQLTALQLLWHLHSSKKPLSQLASVLVPYPQVMQNIKISAKGKLSFYNNEAVQEAINSYKEIFKDDGRVVVRVSGTEPLIRVMAEGKDEKLVKKSVKELSEIIIKEIC